MKKILLVITLCALSINIFAGARADAIDYKFQIASCVGTQSSTAWVGENVVVIIEAETPADRNQTIMDSVMVCFDLMEAKYMEITGKYDYPMGSSYDGKPVVEIVLDNCGAGGLASHGSLGMSTGKHYFDIVYNAIATGKRAMHQVFLYETNRNFWEPPYNKKFDWAMNGNDQNYGWWTVGMNNAQAVMMTMTLDFELIGPDNEDQAGFRQTTMDDMEAYLNNSFYSFEYGWNQSMMPWATSSSINDLMSGLFIYSYENFGGEVWLKNFYSWIQSDEIPSRTHLFAYQECRDNIYKIWSMAAECDLKNFFEVDMRWNISAEAKEWVAMKQNITLSSPGALAAIVSSNNIQLAWMDNSTVETGYTLERSVNDEEFTSLAELSADVITYTDNTAAASTTYSYRVKATDANTSSLYSNIVEIALEDVAPNAPEGIATRSMSSSSIKIQWEEVTDVDAYVIELKQDDDSYVRVGGTIKTSFTVSDLSQHNASYTFRMASIKGNVTSDYTAEFVEVTEDVVPVAPRSIRLYAESESVKVTWLDNSDNEDGFTVYYQVFGKLNWNKAGNALTGTDEYTVTGLDSEVEYSFMVRAYNEAGKSESSSIRSIETLSATAIKENDAFGLKIYPNPATDKLSVSVDRASEMMLYDASGRIVYTLHLEANETAIDVSAFTSGIYFMKIEDNDSSTIKRIVIR